MRKFLSIIGLALFIFLGGCSQVQKTDDAFFADLASTWQDRTETMKKVEKENDITKSFKAIFETELKGLEKYENADFEDPELGQTVQNYLKEVRACLEALDTDQLGYDDLENYLNHYDKRVGYLKELSKDKRYVLPEGSEDDLALDREQIKKDKAKAEERTDILKKFKEDLNKLSFQGSKDANGQTNISGQLSNTTGADLANFTITIKFLDKDGNEVDKQSEKIDVLKNGETKELKYSTDKDFASVAPDLNLDNLEINKP